MYIPAREDCQRNKAPTKKPSGLLHPLPVPDGHCESVTIDFIGPLPLDDGYNCIVMLTCCLNSDIRLVPTHTDISAERFAELFFREWYCDNGLPLDIVSDRDKLFISRFWKALLRLTGVKAKMSTAYHPQTDGASERTNKTVIQSLRYHVEHNQKGWARALPIVRFNLMNTVNASTGFSPFQLRYGRSPRIIPPVFKSMVDDVAADLGTGSIDATALLSRIDTDVMEAQDNLLLAKTTQAHHANTHRGDELPYHVGDKVLLSTFHWRRDYMQRGDNRVAKLMVRYDGPYTILEAWPETSTYRLDLPESSARLPVFHAALLRPFVANDGSLFPSRAHAQPGPIVTEDGVQEWYVERILDRQRRGRGYRYLVRWKGYGPEHDEWLPGAQVADLEALDGYLRDNGLPGVDESEPS